MFLVVIALIFYLVAYFADTVVDEWPRIRGYAYNIRGLVDDVTMGDPNKIVRYQGASALVTAKGDEFANVKFAIKGYVYFGGVTARNHTERALLANTAPGNAIMVYYDPANPTITVMQATYLEACSKVKGTKSVVTRTTDFRKSQRKFLPGTSRPLVEQIRIVAIMVGTVFLILGARGKSEE